ncbi:MAG: amidohydrolase family protein [Aliishimia sp.]
MSRDLLVPRALLRHPERFGGTPQGDFLRGVPVFSDARLIALKPAFKTPTPSIVIPALTDAHCHLDKCHTIHRLGTVGGNLMQAIETQKRDKVNWTESDLRHRATRGLKEAQSSGCSTMRTHVDWGQDAHPPLSWSVLTELAQDTEMHVQCAALIGIDQMADPNFAATAAQHVAQRNGVLGSFIMGHAETVAGVRQAFLMAERFGLALDFHVDEGLGDFNGLEIIADIALETLTQIPILCGHAVSLMDRTAEDFARIADKLARADISICALPTTNLYLQGRTTGTPDRRGITKLQELREAGVQIVVASDNVGDAFCPTGAHDPMQALYIATLGAHLDPPLDRWLSAITTDARRALGLPPLHIETAPRHQLRLCKVSSIADLIAGRAAIVPFET